MSAQQIKDVIWSRWLSTGSPAKAINAAADELARLLDEERSEAERRGAVKALRAAAIGWHDAYVTHVITRRADAVENGADL